MDIKETILNVMREAGKPVSAGEVEKLSGLDRKDIDKAFKELDEALKMYPKGFYGYLLKSSYDKGKDGFLSAEGADF